MQKTEASRHTQRDCALACRKLPWDMHGRSPTQIPVAEIRIDIANINVCSGPNAPLFPCHQASSAAGVQDEQVERVLVAASPSSCACFESSSLVNILDICWPVAQPQGLAQRRTPINKLSSGMNSDSYILK